MQVTNKHLEKADRLLQKGKLDAALEEYLLAWKEEPANDGIVYTVAELYQRLSRAKESRECYLFLYERALERGDWPKAVELLRRVQTLGPLEPSRLISAAQLLEKHRPDLAVEQYRRAMEIAGEKDLEATLQCLQGLARMQPDSVELNRQVALTAARLGNNTVATAACYKVADLCVAQGKPKEACEALEQVCGLAPKDKAARIALSRAYLKAGELTKIIALWNGIALANEDREVVGLLAQAHVAAGQTAEAEELYWKALETVPGAPGSLLDIARGYLQDNKPVLLSSFMGRLEEQLDGRRPQKDLIYIAEGLVRLQYRNVAFLERLAGILDRLHVDSPLANIVGRLFEIRFESGQFQEATEVLDRLISIDPYDPQNSSRLERLQGKIDAARLHELGTQLGLGQLPPPGDPPASADGSSSDEPETVTDPGSPLRDLMLQAEIFLQYRMQDKARERLQRILTLMPGEEKRNEELAGLLERAGVSAEAPAATVIAPGGDNPEGHDIRANLKRVSEMSRTLSRQGTVKAVLFAAVNDIGRHWKVSRCVAGLATANRPPSLALEYISPGIQPSDPAKLGRLVMGLQAAAGSSFPLVAETVQESPALAPLQETLSALQVDSLVAIPLRDGEQEIGMLILQQCGGRRQWKSNDLAGLEALAEQIVLAVSNVRLRSLVKALAVTDEHSGLLHRDSYLSCLLSEAERMRTQKIPLSVILLHFSRPGDARPVPLSSVTESAMMTTPAAAAAVKDKGLDETIQAFSSAVTSHLRQNDMAVRYAADKLALILPGANAKDASTVTEKMRKLIQSAQTQSKQAPLLIAAGVAEAARDSGMDSIDCITELVNRLESALDAARQDNGNQLKVLEPPFTVRANPTVDPRG